MKNDSAVCHFLPCRTPLARRDAAFTPSGCLGAMLLGPTLLGQCNGLLRGREMKPGRYHGTTFALILACSGLVACADAPIRLAPVFLNGGPGMAAARSAATKAATPDNRFVIVGPGQSLGVIAEANHVPKQAIIAANHLSPPYKLKIGQTLRLPVSVAASGSSREKVAAVPKRPTVLADTRSSKPVASEEVIPLDETTSSTSTATDAAPSPPLKGRN
jgi:LysM repeat protein